MHATNPADVIIAHMKSCLSNMNLHPVGPHSCFTGKDLTDHELVFGRHPGAEKAYMLLDKVLTDFTTVCMKAPLQLGEHSLSANV